MVGKGKNILDLRLHYEKEFFDKRASEIGDRDLSIKTDYSKALRILGIDTIDLEGKHILDCGCGFGELTVWLATKGSHVYAIDVSPKSLEVLKKRAALYEVCERIEARIMPVEILEYEDNRFDFVFGKWILHHVLLEKTILEIYRVLKPGGKGIFLETSATNKVLMFFRRFVIGHFGIPKFQDEIEHPITQKDIQEITDGFGGNCDVYYFPYTFVKLLDSYIFRHRSKFVTHLLNSIDHFIYQYIPFLRKYSYFKIIAVSKTPGCSCIR